MCGIVFGISNDSLGMDSLDAKVFYNLLTVDVVRGEDGTGMYWLDNKGKPWYSKSEGHVGESFARTKVNGFLSGARFAVGHNRAATLGKVNEENTHPFIYPNVVGVHNGTITDWNDFAEDATMDSMAVFELLNSTDPDATSTTKALAKLGSGAYALVWYDGRTKELRFARNSQRPLHFAITKTGMIWGASELRMLEWILHRNEYKIDKSFQLDSHILLSLPVQGGTPDIKAYQPEYKQPSYSSWYGDYDPPGWKTYGGYREGNSKQGTFAQQYIDTTWEEL